jgi:hypothetical protein
MFEIVRRLRLSAASDLPDVAYFFENLDFRR